MVNPLEASPTLSNFQQPVNDLFEADGQIQQVTTHISSHYGLDQNLVGTLSTRTLQLNIKNVNMLM